MCAPHSPLLAFTHASHMRLTTPLFMLPFSLQTGSICFVDHMVCPSRHRAIGTTERSGICGPNRAPCGAAQLHAFRNGGPGPLHAWSPRCSTTQAADTHPKGGPPASDRFVYRTGTFSSLLQMSSPLTYGPAPHTFLQLVRAPLLLIDLVWLLRRLLRTMHAPHSDSYMLLGPMLLMRLRISSSACSSQLTSAFSSLLTPQSISAPPPP